MNGTTQLCPKTMFCPFTNEMLFSLVEKIGMLVGQVLFSEVSRQPNNFCKLLIVSTNLVSFYKVIVGKSIT